MIIDEEGRIHTLNADIMELFRMHGLKIKKLRTSKEKTEWYIMAEKVRCKKVRR